MFVWHLVAQLRLLLEIDLVEGDMVILLLDALKLGQRRPARAAPRCVEVDDGEPVGRLDSLGPARRVGLLEHRHGGGAPVYGDVAPWRGKPLRGRSEPRRGRDECAFDK
eukprot:6586464-Prymnesium_polylepis.1